MSFDWQDLGTQVSRSEFLNGPEDPEQRNREREAELNEAYQRGFDDGSAHGLEEALRGLDPARDALEKAVARLAVLREEMAGQAQENIMALALTVARRVMEREIQVAPETITELVQKALNHFPLDHKVKVRLHPSDLAFLSGEGSGRPPVETAGRDVRWLPDDSVSRGGCLVEGPEHVVDGRLDTALERIYRTVFHD